jgi:hypothetical protein
MLEEYLFHGGASEERSVIEASRQRATERKLKILSHK